MKQPLTILLLVLLVNFSSYAQEKRYEPTEQSLNTYEIPGWFKDAKFGIYTHWGPVSSVYEGSDPNKWYSGWHGMLMYSDGKIVPTKNGKPANNYLHHQGNRFYNFVVWC